MSNWRKNGKLEKDAKLEERINKLEERMLNWRKNARTGERM